MDEEQELADIYEEMEICFRFCVWKQADIRRMSKTDTSLQAQGVSHTQSALGGSARRRGVLNDAISHSDLQALPSCPRCAGSKEGMAVGVTHRPVGWHTGGHRFFRPHLDTCHFTG